jgi:hypothetical protein
MQQAELATLVRLSLFGRGLLTAVALLAMLFWLPYHLLPTNPAPFATELFAFIITFTTYTLITAPFDWYGSRQRGISPSQFFPRWLRGILPHTLSYLLIAFLLLWAGRYLGWSFFFVVFVSLMFFLAFIQPEMARAVAHFQPVKYDLTAVRAQLQAWGIPQETPVHIWHSPDTQFTGGIVGVIGRHQIILPARWLETWSTSAIAVYLARREFLLAQNSYLRGALLSFTAQVLGMILVILALARWVEPNSVAAIVSVSLSFTIWSFFSDALLSWLDRRGVFTADQHLLQHGIPRELLSQAFYSWDGAQGDLPRAAETALSWPYPHPSALNRVSRLDKLPPKQPWMPWQTAFTGQYYSWAGLNWLARLAPPLMGNTAVWVIPISD